MEEEVLNKIYANEIIQNIKQKTLSPMELAHLIDEFLKSQLAKGLKLEQIEEELGITKRVLYKYRSLLKVPLETIEEYQDDLSFEQMSIVSYSLKDKEKIPAVLEQVRREQIPSSQLVYKVAELNDKRKVNTHILNELVRINLWAIGLKDKVKVLTSAEQKQVRKKITEVVGNLRGV